MKNFLNENGLFYGFLLTLYMIILGYLKPQEPAVFLLWLASMILITIRLRLGKSLKWLYIDVILVLLMSVYHSELIMLILVIMALLTVHKHYTSLLLSAVVLAVLRPVQLEIILIILYSISVPLLLSIWRDEIVSRTKMIDALRQKTYALENEKESLMASQSELSRISILSERDRIAQKLHDDLGHELTASLLALRAYETIHENASLDERFIALKSRIESSVEALKDTVEQTKPDEHYGFERFKALLSAVKDIPVQFTHQGNLLALSETHFYMLSSVLKEALTNAQKHATPSAIEVALQVNNHVVKLTIKNDGIHPVDNKAGSGLKYMRKKIEALNGHLTIQKSFYFTLICVLPCTLESE